jgi:hypothetical protein
MDFIITKSELEGEIQKIAQAPQKRIVMYDQVIGFCQKVLEDYRRGIRLENFGEISSEIRFFKDHKQHPQSYLIFYHNLLRYELEFPNQEEVSRRKYVLRKIGEINEFFLSQIDFIQYLELEQDHLDEFYFTRKFNNKGFHSNRIYDRDPQFSTSHDLLLSELKAQKLFLSFLQSKLLEMDHPKEKSTGASLGLLWTGSKTGLIELIYALYSDSAINNGTVELSTITASFEEFFNVKLDNVYKTYFEIKTRKGSKTKYLEELMIKLQQKIHKDDAF